MHELINIFLQWHNLLVFLPLPFLCFWSASSSTTKQESYALQAAADNGAVNFGATYIGGNTGGASASANASLAGGTPRTRAQAQGGAANTARANAAGGNTGVQNQEVAATGQYGVGVGAGAVVTTGGVSTGAGSTVTIAEPTEAVAALNAALAIAAAAQNTSESVALEALDAMSGVGPGTGRGYIAQPGTTASSATPTTASGVQYVAEFGIVLALVVGVGYFLTRKKT